MLLFFQFTEKQKLFDSLESIIFLVVCQDYSYVFNLFYNFYYREGVRIIAEQVSHHPPVSAFYSDSPHYTYSGAIHPKLKLWARSVEIKPEGTVILKLKR